MSEITKGDIIGKVTEHGVPECCAWISTFLPGTDIAPRTIESSIQKVLNDLKKIKKNKSKTGFSEKLNSFNCEKYTFPKPLKFPVKRKSHVLDCDSVDITTVKSVAISLACDLNDSLNNNKALAVENEELKKNSQQTSKLRHKVKNYRNEVPNLKKQISYLKTQVLIQRNTIKRIRAQSSYNNVQRQRAEDLLKQQQRKSNQLQDEFNEKISSLEDLKKEINDLKEENDYLKILLDNHEVILFDEDSKIYLPSTNQCIYELLNHNVTTSNVSPVIAAVLKLANLKANRLPSKSTVNNMNIQRLILAQKQLSENLLEKSDVCLLSDETSKYGRKIEGFHLSDKDGKMWVLGLREMATKSGSDTLFTLNNILDDINEASNCSENEVSKHILLSIVSTMSDRAATQKKFNELLEEYRKMVLMENLGDAWLQMTQDEQLSISRLSNFFCGLHALVHIAEAASRSLLETENILFESGAPSFDTGFRTKQEAGAVRLIRTTSKGFSCGGDEKSGAYGQFNLFVKDFLKENNLKSVPIPRFHGNRFNILFSTASNVFFMHEKVREYLRGDNSNRLLRSIKFDIEVPEYLAGCKALGLISYFITTPLWCLVEDRNVHIMDSAQYYREIVNFIDDCIENTETFIDGGLMLSFSHFTEDAVYRALVKPWVHDNFVVLILKSILTAINVTVKKLFGDFLEGMFDNPSDMARERTSSVPKHNKFSESIFGHVDRILREKPSITTIAKEAIVMFCHNKTLQWLETHTDKEKLIASARLNVKTVRENFKRRQAEIEAKRKEIVLEKLRAAEITEQNRVQKLQNCTNKMLEWGLWQSEEQVNYHLSLCKTKREKQDGLKAQLLFRKEVLQQKIKDDQYKNIYSFSKNVGGKRVLLTVDELVQNLKVLIRHAFSIPSAEEEDNPIFVGRKIRMKFLSEGQGGEHWETGFVISKVPGYPEWSNVKFDLDPAIYTYKLSEDYSAGDLEILM